MKVAALYWPTSSVGGINTELRAFRDEADERGDTFHVLRSANAKRGLPILFQEERKLIRGGDTFITIDGEAPHGAMAEQTAKFIKENYDSVYLGFLCPHPTKDYGDQPVFLDLLRKLAERKVPITGRVTDGYWETYAEWGAETIKLCKAVTVSQPAFASFFSHPRVKASRFPFSPRKPEPVRWLYGPAVVEQKPERSKKPLTVWTSQWKAIKGIHKLLPHLPEIKHRVELYSNGILYYQLRETPEWKKAVGLDYFGATTPSGAFNGKGVIPFYGYIPLEDIPCVLSRAWFMIDLMGVGKPKNKVYTEGSFNNTTVEALWYGCCPVLHEQARKTVPGDIAIFVSEASQVPTLVNDKKLQAFAVSAERQGKARAWVRANFDRAKLYDTAVLGRFK